MDAPEQTQSSTPGAAAGDMAADALKAAEAAVSSLKQDAGVSAAAPPSAADDPAAAALKAAEAAISQAKARNDAPDASAAASNTVGGTAPIPPGSAPRPFSLPSFGSPASGSKPEAIDLLGDVNLNVKIELGRTRMLVEDVLRLGEGSVVELDKLAGDPVDIYVNDRHVARGEVLVLNDNFCVRINEIVSPVGDQLAAR